MEAAQRDGIVQGAVMLGPSLERLLISLIDTFSSFGEFMVIFVSSRRLKRATQKPRFLVPICRLLGHPVQAVQTAPVISISS